MLLLVLVYRMFTFKRKSFGISSAGLALLFGCTHPTPLSPANLISQNDFESLKGWVEVPPTLTTDRAHSGKYCSKVDASIEYGLCYTTTLAEAGLKAGQTIEVSAWGLRTAEPTNGAIVVQLIDPANGQQLYWEALDMATQVHTYNRWMLLEKTFTLPMKAKDSHQLRVYPWRYHATQATYFDDLRIMLVD